MKLIIVMNPDKDNIQNVHMLKEWLKQRAFLKHVDVDVVKRRYVPDSIKDYETFNREFALNMMKDSWPTDQSHSPTQKSSQPNSSLPAQESESP